MFRGGNDSSFDTFGQFTDGNLAPKLRQANPNKNLYIEDSDIDKGPPIKFESPRTNIVDQSYVLRAQMMPRPTTSSNLSKPRPASSKQVPQLQQAQVHKSSDSDQFLANIYNEMPVNRLKMSKQTKATSISSGKHRSDPILHETKNFHS